jgi:hypothetical protein
MNEARDIGLVHYYASVRSAMMNACLPQVELSGVTAFIQTVFLTACVTCVFLLGKSSYESWRKRTARVRVVVVGGGPTGLLACLVALHSGRASRISVYEERRHSELMQRPQQVALAPTQVHFLKGLGVDFDNMEGCWQHKCFYTRVGILQEHLLSILYKYNVDTKMGHKVGTVCL